MNFRFFIFCVEFCIIIFLPIVYEFLSGFRDRFQKRVTCVAFSIEFAKKIRSCPYSSTASPEVQQHSPFPTILVGNPASGARAFEVAEAAVRHGFDGRARSCQFLVKFRSFSAVSAPIFASKYVFCSIFQNLPDYLADNFGICKILQILQNFAKKKC